MSSRYWLEALYSFSDDPDNFIMNLHFNSSVIVSVFVLYCGIELCPPKCIYDTHTYSVNVFGDCACVEIIQVK